jgi:UDP-N-acetylmuramoyl-L-alanyl-D-glutamate--2,6-diaminopimelate ligase
MIFSVDLSSLLQSAQLPCPPALLDRRVERLVTDSRQCQGGDLFIGLPGTKVDGGEFALQALRQGAVACVVNASYQGRFQDERIIFSPDVVGDCAQLANAFYDYPSRSLTLIGVTGTNGKTTTTHLIEHILHYDREQFQPALFGTLYTRWQGFSQIASHTTPFAVELQSQLRQAVDNGCKTAVMEVSSHALAQRRVWGCPFQVAVFTNLTQDHLDFHGTLENYFQAKSLLFSPEYLTGRAIVNWDDNYGKRLTIMLDKRQALLWTYSIHNQLTDIYLREVEYGAEGFTAQLHTPAGDCALRSPLVGKFNVSNVLSAVGAALHLGMPLDTIVKAVEEFTGVPGRMQKVQVSAEQDITVVVDYAHTPDSLENVLKALRPFTQNRLICVFGCGGDRDRTKRPIMGEIAHRLADVVYLTSDNPRTEDPAQILADIGAGMHSYPNAVQVIIDRRTCIHEAISHAQAGDTVLLAGKGHEDYQIIGTTKIPFDDRHEAELALKARLI